MHPIQSRINFNQINWHCVHGWSLQGKAIMSEKRLPATLDQTRNLKKRVTPVKLLSPSSQVASTFPAFGKLPMNLWTLAHLYANLPHSCWSHGHTKENIIISTSDKWALSFSCGGAQCQNNLKTTHLAILSCQVERNSGSTTLLSIKEPGPLPKRFIQSGLMFGGLAPRTSM